MPMPTSSLRFAGNTLLHPRIAGSPWPAGMGYTFSGATQVTLGFWLKVNALPSWGSTAPVSFYPNCGMYPAISSGGSVTFVLWTKVDSHGGQNQADTNSAPVNLGSWDHWLAVFDGSGSGRGTLTVYRNGEPTLSCITPADGPNYWFSHQLFSVGNYWPTEFSRTGGDFQVAEIAAWNGYLGTQQDAAELTSLAKRPTDIATPQRLIYISGDGGTSGATAAPSDAGVLSQGHPDFSSNEGFTYDLTPWGQGTGPGGTITYGEAPSYSPPVVASPYVAGSGTGLGILFVTKGGQKAHIPRTATRANVLVAGMEPTLTIQRQGGGTTVATLDPDFAYFSNSTGSDATGKEGQDYLYFDLKAQGIAAIGPGDTARVTADRHWIVLTEGYCDALDADAPQSGPLPAVPAVRAMDIGYNLEPPFAFNLPYYGNMARWMDRSWGRYSNGWPDYGVPRLANGQPCPGMKGEAGYYAEAILLNPDYLFGMDECATRGPAQDQPPQQQQYANAYYDNADEGTAGFKLGHSYRAIPRRGKIHVAWDYLEGHDGDGSVSVCLGEWSTDENPSLDGGGNWGNQVYSWTFNPTVTPGTGGANYHRTYEYVGNDPINGLGASGARLTPQLRLRWTGYATNFRVTVEADPDLPEAAYNVDKFAPDLFHPYLTDEVLRGIKTVRIMNWADAYDTGTSDVSQYTPYDHYTWGQIFSGMAGDQGYPTEVGITAITRYTGAEAVAMRSTYAGGAGGGGCPLKLTLSSPHYLATGATFEIDWGSSVTLQCVSDQDGQTYPINMYSSSWPRAVRVMSPTEIFMFAWFDQPGGGNPFGVLDRDYSGADLAGAKIMVNRRRTLPIRAVGELATRCNLNIHYNLPYGIALDPARVAAWADALAPHFPADRELHVECGNEPWNTDGKYSLSLYAAGDELGLIGGQPPGVIDCYVNHVRVSARAAKAVRQRWAAHGLDPSKVKCLLNTGPGSWLGQAIPAIQEMNNSGDPLLRVDEISPNTYMGNFGEHEDLAAFPGYDQLDAEQSIDLFELVASRGNYPFMAVRNQRAALDASGLSDVGMTSYEGGPERITVGGLESEPFDHTDIASQRSCARMGMLQTGIFHHPRWAGVIRAWAFRLQAMGMKYVARYVATAPPWPGRRNPGRMPSRNWWTSYLSMQPSGVGDGSDGKWDNRVTALRPYGPYVAGESVSVDAYAIKSWNTASIPTRKKYPMIDWATSWTADSVVAASAMNHNDTLTGDAVDLDSQSAVELGFTITKTEGNGTITVLMLNAVDGTSYESPGAASNGQVIALLPGAGTEHYRVQFDARTMSQAKPYIKASLGNNGIYNAQVVRISSITMKTRVGVEI